MRRMEAALYTLQLPDELEAKQQQGDLFGTTEGVEEEKVTDEK